MYMLCMEEYVGQRKYWCFWSQIDFK